MDNTEEIVPQHLYKYKAFPKTFTEWKRLIELLRDTKIYFSSPKDLNDPYDCKIVQRFQGMDKASLKNGFRSLGPRNKNMNDIEEEKNLEIVCKNILNDSNAHNKIYQTQEKIYNEGYGIYSLTDKCDSMPMWTYYTKNSGICLEYSSTIMKQKTKQSEFFYLEKIIYVEDYPHVPPFGREYLILGRTVPNYLVPILFKGVDWLHESEWRFCHLFMGENINLQRNIQFANNILTGIYFGINATDKQIAFIKRIIENNNPQPILYKMELVPYSFKLRAKCIS